MNQNSIVAAAVVAVEAVEVVAVGVAVAAIVEVAAVVVAVVVGAEVRRLATRRATIVVSRDTLPANAPMLAWKGMTAKSSTRRGSNIDVASTVARWDTFPPTARNRLVTRLVTIVEKKGISRVIARKRRKQ